MPALAQTAKYISNRSATPFVWTKTADEILAKVSVEYAFAHRSASLPFVRAHAQEMSEDVMCRHIDLYVNEYSVDLGTEGKRAAATLFDRARAIGLSPETRDSLFLQAS